METTLYLLKVECFEEAEASAATTRIFFYKNIKKNFLFCHIFPAELNLKK